MDEIPRKQLSSEPTNFFNRSTDLAGRLTELVKTFENLKDLPPDNLDRMKAQKAYDELWKQFQEEQNTFRISMM